jgi:hypothetical protein
MVKKWRLTMAFRQRIALLLVFILLSGAAYAEKLATLTDVLKPLFLAVDTDRFYVTDGFTIFIYSMKDFKLIKKFGKEGEGPQEFMRFVMVTPRADDLLVNSLAKISFFSKDGEYKSEVKTSVLNRFFIPMGKQYVGRSGKQGDVDKKFYLTINIFDENLKVVKELFKYENFMQLSGDINPVCIRQALFYVSGDKIFIENKPEGLIVCFDGTGKELPVIDPKIKRRKFTKADEDRYRNFYKNDPRYREDYEMLKPRLKFPDYFNPIDYMWVTGGKIYVMTFKQEGGSSEFIIFDTAGKFIKRRMSPYHHPNILERAPSDIKDGKLYQIIENEDEEEWELHVTSVL